MRFRLTVDRQKVMQSIEVARQKEEAWPEWELFWPQHPVCEWLDDRVLSALGRHEAWVVRVPDGLEPDDVLFLFQGVYSNQRSQSVLVDWFAVPFQGTVPQPTVPRDEVLRRCGLRDVQGNPGVEAIPAVLPSLRQAAVDRARDHMKELRNQRAAQLGDPLRQGLRELAAWRDRSQKRLADQRLVAARGGAKVPAPIRRRIEAEERFVQTTYEERKLWIEQGIKTVPEPYLRLAAVFIRADLT